MKYTVVVNCSFEFLQYRDFLQKLKSDYSDADVKIVDLYHENNKIVIYYQNGPEPVQQTSDFTILVRSSATHRFDIEFLHGEKYYRTSHTFDLSCINPAMIKQTISQKLSNLPTVYTIGDLKSAIKNLPDEAILPGYTIKRSFDTDYLLPKIEMVKACENPFEAKSMLLDLGINTVETDLSAENLRKKSEKYIVNGSIESLYDIKLRTHMSRSEIRKNIISSIEQLDI